MNEVAAFALMAGCSIAMAEDCGPTPYSVQAKEKLGAIEIMLPSALANDTLKPASVSAAAQYVKKTYAAMVPTVINGLLRSYQCHVFQAIDADARLSAEEKQKIRIEWTNAAMDLKEAVTLYAVAFDAGTAKDNKPEPQVLSASARPLALYVTALPIDNFTLEDRYGGYIGANISGISASACGSYLRAALAENSAVIQNFAAVVRPALVDYFSSDAGPRVAKSSLFTETGSAYIVSTLPRVSKETDALLKQCISSEPRSAM